jgi:aromatic-L-amino-acid decarboxylase
MRSFRALKVWMCLKHRGVAGFRAAIDHVSTMASRLADKIGEMPDVQSFAPRELSIVCLHRQLPRDESRYRHAA